MRSGPCSIQIKTYLPDSNKISNGLERGLPSQRPTTLKLNQNLNSKEQWFELNKPELINQQTDKEKPAKKWSSLLILPNQGSGSTTPTSPALSLDKFEEANCNSPSIQSSHSHYSDSPQTEISVNVSLSPKSDHNRHTSISSNRHQSTIHFRPELPFVRNFGNQKSYTSVNLVLRQPDSNLQSPINIRVGPNLTCVSPSCHSRQGYQNNYHITVTDGGGVFSAIRIHPSSYSSSPVRYVDKDSSQRKSVNLQTTEPINNSTVANFSHFNGQSDEHQIIMRQRKQMDKIVSVLRKNKNELELVQKELKHFAQPVRIDTIADRLDCEIKKLRFDCQALLCEIENSRMCDLNGFSVEHASSIKRSHQHPFPR